MPKRRKLNPSSSSPSLRTLPKRSHPCPICNTSIPTSDLSAHYEQERSLLTSQVAPQETKRPAAVIALSKIVDRPRQKRSEVSSLLSRVRGNRQKRRTQFSSSGFPDHETDETREGIEECPVCGVCLLGVETSIFEHVSECLQRRLRDERQEEGEQWQVHGHERAVDMLEGGILSLPNTVIVNGESHEEVDVFIDVEGDSEEVYGKVQYTEDDLRNPTKVGKVADVRCNICLNGYVTPVVSVQCFHVYCEGCWLLALREQKLCPQCRLITQPTDLRRVYL